MQAHGDDIYRYKGIRLNFSSNVYNGFDHTALKRHLEDNMQCIGNYPEPTPQTLERRLAQTLGIEADEVVVTNGACEAIYLIAQAWRGADSCILQPTFSEYAEACRIHKHGIVKQGGDMLWLCNPNNPTGEVLPKAMLTAQIEAHPNVVFVIDQSYGRFTHEPLLTEAEAVGYGNVILLHSMTKEYGIPGLRLGYAIGSATLLENIRRVRMPWAVNSLAIVAGEHLLDHKADYAINIDALLAETQRLSNALKQIDGIEVYPSDSHILLCRTTRIPAPELKERLARDHGILIRDASNFEGLDESYFRIAAQGFAPDNELLTAIKQAYDKL